MAQQTDNFNRVEDTSSKEKKPKAGVETGRQSTYIGANIPGALGAAGILTVNPTALGTLGVAGLGYGGWGGMGGGLSGCAGVPFGWGTPEQFSSSVYLRSTQRQPEIIRNYFHEKNVRYAAAS